MTMTIENALASYQTPIDQPIDKGGLGERSKPYIPEPIQTVKVNPEITAEHTKRFEELNQWLDSLALTPSQTMTRRIRVKCLPGNSRFVLRKDKKTKKDIIVDRHNQDNENTELIAYYLINYCRRKMTTLRQGKGKGKNIDLDHNKEVYNRKKDGKRLLRKMPTLKGSQDHIRQTGLDDAMDACQTALMFWVQNNQKTWLSRLSESELIAYIHSCKLAKKCTMPCVSQMPNRKPLTFRILAIGCFQTMREAYRFTRKVDSKVWQNRHGIARIGDELAKDELAKGMPSIVSMPIQEIREELENLPTESRTQRATKNILLMRLNGKASADIARELGYPFAFVRNAISRFRKCNPYLCHKVLTPV